MNGADAPYLAAAGAACGGTVLMYCAMAAICSGSKLKRKPGIRGVPLLMYSRINSSSPPRVSRESVGAYCLARCCTGVWQTPQDWLNRRNPSFCASLNDASGEACANAADADATTNAATRTLRCIEYPPGFAGFEITVLGGDLTPCGGGVKRLRGRRGQKLRSCHGCTGRSLPHARQSGLGFRRPVAGRASPLGKAAAMQRGHKSTCCNESSRAKS